jgi:hypothetical protein
LDCGCKDFPLDLPQLDFDPDIPPHLLQLDGHFPARLTARAEKTCNPRETFPPETRLRPAVAGRHRPQAKPSGGA